MLCYVGQAAALGGLRDFVLMCFVWWLSDATSNLLSGAARAKFSQMLKTKFVECLLLQDFEYFERHGAGVLQARLNGDVEEVAESLLSLPKEVLRKLIIIATRLAVAWSIAPKDVLGVALLPVPVVALLSKLLLDYRSRREERSRRVAEASIDDTGRQALNSRRARPRGPTRPRRRS